MTLSSLIVAATIPHYGTSKLERRSEPDDLIIESRNDEFVDTRIGVPFGAYYFLVFILLFNTRWRRMMLLIHIYNFLLFLISPILAILLLNGLYWLAPAINAHEIS